MPIQWGSPSYITVPLASRKFFVGARWATMLIAPVLMGLSTVRTTPAMLWLLGFFALITLVLQVRLFTRPTRLDQWLWYAAFLTDLLVITGIIMARGGLRTDVYLLYILVMNEAGMILGVWQAIVTGITACTLYATALLWMADEPDLNRLAVRSIYLMMIGLATAYLASSEKRALVASLTDFKTQLPNFRHFQQILAAAVAHHKRQALPLSAAILDVDNFKALNASIGHPLADKVLEQLADLMVKHKRSMDTLARYGGEEFTMLMPGADLAMGTAEMERFRQLVAEYRFVVVPGGAPVHITISIGVATLKPELTDSQLLVQADRALQEAKANGRNMVRRYSA